VFVAFLNEINFALILLNRTKNIYKERLFLEKDKENKNSK
jgi:hypothetical protein